MALSAARPRERRDLRENKVRAVVQAVVWAAWVLPSRVAWAAEAGRPQRGRRALRQGQTS
jgi:hypothetical protein